MTFELSGTVDLEAHAWDHVVLGCVYNGDVARIFTDLDALLDHLRKVGGQFFCHAGGVYDFLAILERARARGISCSINRSQHRISRIVMGSLTLRDSYALWPVPLDELANVANLPVPSLPWPCICGHDCHGYCQIGLRAAVGDLDLAAYCRADCVVLYDALTKLHGFASDNRIQLKGTLGHTAWISAQDELGIPDSAIDWDTWRHCRRGDKGGRVAIVRPNVHEAVRNYDICSAYPAQLAHALLPVGATTELGGRQALEALGDARPGIYTLTVTIPETMFPPLPWHCGGVLAFPTGEITGSWPLPEIGHAIDCGVKIESVQSAIVFETTAPIFAELRPTLVRRPQRRG